ncbi:MAG TPA: hypothetical protein VIU11_26860 [Nakamurella sp.]
MGDLVVFRDDLLDRTGAAVGIQGGTYTITALLPDGLQTHCVGSASLSDGQISYQVLATDAPVKPLAMIGGTGKYHSGGRRGRPHRSGRRHRHPEHPVDSRTSLTRPYGLLLEVTGHLAGTSAVQAITPMSGVDARLDELGMIGA